MDGVGASVVFDGVGACVVLDGVGASVVLLSCRVGAAVTFDCGVGEGVVMFPLLLGATVTFSSSKRVMNSPLEDRNSSNKHTVRHRNKSSQERVVFVVTPRLGAALFNCKCLFLIAVLLYKLVQLNGVKAVKRNERQLHCFTKCCVFNGS